MAVPRKRIVRIAALQLAKLCAPDVPPQLPADYAVEVGRGSKRATVGAVADRQRGRRLTRTTFCPEAATCQLDAFRMA